MEAYNYPLPASLPGSSFSSIKLILRFSPRYLSNMYLSVVSLLALSGIVTAHSSHDQTPLAGPHQRLWYNTLPGDGGTQVSDFVLSSYLSIG